MIEARGESGHDTPFSNPRANRESRTIQQNSRQILANFAAASATVQTLARRAVLGPATCANACRAALLDARARARRGRVFASARPGTRDPHRFATNDSAVFLLLVTRPARSGKAFGVQLRERGPSRFAP